MALRQSRHDLRSCATPPSPLGAFGRLPPEIRVLLYHELIRTWLDDKGQPYASLALFFVNRTISVEAEETRKKVAWASAQLMLPAPQFQVSGPLFQPKEVHWKKFPLCQLFDKHIATLRLSMAHPALTQSLNSHFPHSPVAAQPLCYVRHLKLNLGPISFNLSQDQKFDIEVAWSTQDDPKSLESFMTHMTSLKTMALKLSFSQSVWPRSLEEHCRLARSGIKRMINTILRSCQTLSVIELFDHRASVLSGGFDRNETNMRIASLHEACWEVLRATVSNELRGTNREPITITEELKFKGDYKRKTVK